MTTSDCSLCDNAVKHDTYNVNADICRHHIWCRPCVGVNKCRVDIITHFREIVYMRFYVSISEKEFLHMIQLSTIFFSMKYMF